MPSINCIEGDLTSNSLLKAALAWAALDVPVLLCFGVDEQGLVIAEILIVPVQANIQSASFFRTGTKVRRRMPLSFAALFAKAPTQTWGLCRQET